MTDYYVERGIFSNALFGVITAIVGIVLFAIVVTYALFGFFTELELTLGMGNFAEWAEKLAQTDWANMGSSLWEISSYTCF